MAEPGKGTGTDGKPGANPGRPDTWIEALRLAGKSDDPLTDLCALLAARAVDFGARRARVLMGHRTGAPALDALRAALSEAGVDLLGADSFALTDGSDGAVFPDATAWAEADAILCLDVDPNSYANAVQFCYDHGLDRPILWRVEQLPAQSCMAGIAAGDGRHAPASDLYIYNYFTKLYRVKDPLQLIWRVVWDDGTVSRGTYLLGPNQSVHFTGRDLDPPREGAGGTVVYQVHHPAFARVPNSRFRGVVDMVGASYCATLHGDEIDPKRTEEGAWFDTHVAPFGGGHDIEVIVRNAVEAPEALTVRLEARFVGTEETAFETVTLDGGEAARTIALSDILAMPEAARPLEVVAEVAGRSYRLEWRERWATPAGATGFLSNHGSTNTLTMKRLIAPDATPDAPDEALMGALTRLAERDVMPLPYPMPVLPARDRFGFSFSVGKFLPHIDFVNLAAFDRAGTLIGRERMAVPPDLGYVGAADTPFAQALADEGGMLLIAPPYVEKGLVTYQNSREDTWLKLSDGRSGDSDIAEFQMHNRNLRGYTIPIGFGQAPQLIKARSELMIRFRRCARFETRLLLLNASPELGFDRSGRVQLEFNLPDGSAAQREIEMAPQTWLFEDISTLLPAAIVEAEYGWVRVLSDELALSAYAALHDREGGGVGFQHLWGA